MTNHTIATHIAPITVVSDNDTYDTTTGLSTLDIASWFDMTPRVR